MMMNWKHGHNDTLDPLGTQQREYVTCLFAIISMHKRSSNF